jgi:hypothetical protein
MSARAPNLAVVAMALAVHVAGCATGAPPELRRSMEEAKWMPTGVFARLRLPGEEQSGELIAVEPEAFILESGGRPRLIPPQCVQHVILARFEGEKGPILQWGAFGTLSALTHGYFFLLTGPVWLISMGIATGSQAAAGILEEPLTKPTPEAMERLRKWARFPQGLPSGYLTGHLPEGHTAGPTGVACGQPYQMPLRWFGQ